MADRTYTLIIKNEESEQKDAVAGMSNSKTSAKNDKKNSGGDPVKAGIVAWRTVKPFISSAISHRNNMVLLETGSVEYTQKLQFEQQVSFAALGFVESMLMGFAVTGGNPAGAIVGATIAFMGQMQQITNNQDRLNKESALEYQSISRNGIRSGISGSRRIER